MKSAWLRGLPLLLLLIGAVWAGSSLPTGRDDGRLTGAEVYRHTLRGVACRYDVDALWAHSVGEVRQVQTLKEGYFSEGKELAKGARVVSAQVPINEGDSGGPLVNERGEVVGVAAAVTWEAHGAGLFIDAAEVRVLADITAPPPPQPPPGPFAARDVYREGVRSLALVRTEGDRRSSAW